MIVRKVSSNHFDTYFINDNDPFFEFILEKIKMKNSNKAISQRDSGFVFLNINFSNFQISQPKVSKHKTQSSLVPKQYRRSSDSKRRKATELYAEEFVKNYLEKRVYKFIQKFGMPYDLKFSKEIKALQLLK